MEKQNFVLAMYDIRGKQDFIFRTNKLKEIVGASWLIRDCFEDYLFPAAEKVSKEINGEKGKGIFSYKREEEGDFQPDRFEEHLKEGYIGEVVYDGGGNFLLLFQNKEIFQNVTYAFTKSLMESVGSLHVLGTCVETDDFLDYVGDNKKLYQEHRKNEMKESSLSPWACPPFAQVDRQTSMPFVDISEIKTPEGICLNEKLRKKIAAKGKMTKETYAKLLKYYVEIDKLGQSAEQGKITDTEKKYYENENILDNLVEEKGVDSKLAVVYIDGNSMGAKVQEVTQQAGSESYEDCVSALRNFSEEIQNLYVAQGIEHALKDTDEKGYRIVVSAGDEINFIVKAKDAFQCARNYLDALHKNNMQKEKDGAGASACAGIAVFHSHAPYAEAYRIAEECCESGKKAMKEAELSCASFIDFHICQGAIGTSLEEIRKEENEKGGKRILSRPWLLWKEGEPGKEMEITEFGDLQKDIPVQEAHGNEKETISFLCQILQKFGRSNVKGLAEAAKNSGAALEMELRRMWAHAGNEVKSRIGEDNWSALMAMGDERKRKMIYDIVIAYDLWFAEEKEEEGRENA